MIISLKRKKNVKTKNLQLLVVLLEHKRIYMSWINNQINKTNRKIKKKKKILFVWTIHNVNNSPHHSCFPEKIKRKVNDYLLKSWNIPCKTNMRVIICIYYIRQRFLKLRATVQLYLSLDVLELFSFLFRVLSVRWWDFFYYFTMNSNSKRRLYLKFQTLTHKSNKKYNLFFL